MDERRTIRELEDEARWMDADKASLFPVEVRQDHSQDGWWFDGEIPPGINRVSRVTEGAGE